MRLITITEYDHESMVLAKPIYDAKKRILIAQGRSISPKVLQRIKDMGINHLFVEDETSKGINIDDMLDMPTWTDSIQSIKTFFSQIQNNQTPDMRGLQELAKKFIDEVKHHPTIILIPAGTMDKEVQPYAHAVNVSLLSLLTGKKLGYNDRRLKDLAIGALLHDIGKKWTSEYQQHPETGFNILRKVSQMSLMSAHMAFQHHESLDGNGFPRQLTGEDFLEVAQICGIANKYENLITKEGYPPHEAMEGVMALSDRSYTHQVVQAFAQAVPTYPPGTKVLIANEPAIVTKIEKHLQRPVIKVLSKGKELDLADYPTLMIKPI